MKQVIFILFTTCFFISSCSTTDKESEKNIKEDSEIKKDTLEDKLPKQSNHLIYDEQRTWGEYNIQVTQNQNHDIVITVLKGNDTLLYDKEEYVDLIDRVDVRDLDSDGKIELYVVSIGGNGAFEYFNMYELEEEELYMGDLKKLYGMHETFFTNDQVIHKQWLETAAPVRYVGFEYTYFELVDNKFKFVKRDEWLHVDEEPTNRSFYD